MQTPSVISLLSFAALSAAACQTAAQVVQPTSEPIEIGQRLRMTSERLGEQREILVSTPSTYDDSADQRLPVFVVLDAGSNFQPTVAAARFLARLGAIPDAIVVGIPGSMRERDFTPPARDGWSPPTEGNWGGAAAFLGFIEEELMPVIEQRYRTQPHRVLIGHSLGGLFAAWALTQRPAVFQGYITLDPSLWWNDRDLVAGVRDALANDANGRIRLVSAEAVGGFAQDWDGISASAHPRFVGDRIAVQGETHQSMPIRGIPEALRALFADWPMTFDSGTHPLTDLEAHYTALSDRLGFDVVPPLSAFTEAARRASDGGDDAAVIEIVDRAVATLGEQPALSSLREQAARAIESGDDRKFIPLVVPADRPTPEALRDWLGEWHGEIDRETGVDSRLELTLEADGDTVAARTTTVYPDRVRRAGTMPIIGLTPDGNLEIGMRLRGAPGLIVWTLHRDDDGSITGLSQVRGFRMPQGVSLGADTMRLTRARQTPRTDPPGLPVRPGRLHHPRQPAAAARNNRARPSRA